MTALQSLAQQSSTPASAPDISASVATTSTQLMEISETPEAKNAAFVALFLAGTDETLTKAVDYFYQSPKLFSETVQNLAKSSSNKDNLKLFLQKLADPETRVRPFMHDHFNAALKATTWSEYRASMRPIFALKDTFEGVDRNRRQAQSCPSAYDMLRTFNDLNDQFIKTYVPLLYKIVGSLDMDK